MYLGFFFCDLEHTYILNHLGCSKKIVCLQDDDDLGESDGMVSAAAKSKCIDIPGKDGGGGDKEVAKTSSSGGGGGGSAGDKFAAVTGAAAGGPPPSQSPGGTSMASKIGSW